MLIDARGLGCPKPVTMAEESLAKIGEGIVEILVDNEAAVKNLSRFASKNSLYVETENIDNYWKVRLVKGYACEVESSELGVKSSEFGEKTEEKDILLIVGTDALGREEGLGKILMKGFFETMKVTKETPHTIFFLNTGVKLTTTDTDIIPILKDIAAMGVEIYSCGTCLKHYNIESELKVGHRGTTNHIVEGIKDFGKVVWIG
ncbi:MAG: sulfurtransferase-like selenium metabolism protein YedF [Nitrospirae bacterium]|nr:sulfurtransferase-like selenium metabolism protein YedF [Nitrospirota bacterium]